MRDIETALDTVLDEREKQLQQQVGNVVQVSQSHSSPCFPAVLSKIFHIIPSSSQSLPISLDLYFCHPPSPLNLAVFLISIFYIFYPPASHISTMKCIHQQRKKS